MILGDAEGDTTLRIKPQARFDGFRVDLLLTLQLIEDGPDGLVISQKQLAIEADGAEFHDRTPEQAIRDRRRDRCLQAMGLSIFRFAGGEVWRDVFACAREYVCFLKHALQHSQNAVHRKQPQSEIGTVSTVRIQSVQG